jgi:hypothetical protein
MDFFVLQNIYSSLFGLQNAQCLAFLVKEMSTLSVILPRRWKVEVLTNLFFDLRGANCRE